MINNITPHYTQTNITKKISKLSQKKIKNHILNSNKVNILKKLKNRNLTRDTYQPSKTNENEIKFVGMLQTLDEFMKNFITK